MQFITAFCLEKVKKNHFLDKFVLASFDSREH